MASGLSNVIDATLGAVRDGDLGSVKGRLGEGQEVIGQIISDPARLVRTGAGMGSPAQVPWLAIFPPGSEARARRGAYVVYLFAADGSAAYLCLSQATDDVRGGLTPLRKRAMDLRRAAGLASGGDEVDLGVNGGRPARYSAATAAAVRYEAGRVPPDAQLTVDLKSMLEALDRAAESGLDLHCVTEPIHLVLKWSAGIEAQTVELHRKVADEKGSVWWGKFGTSNKPIGKKKLQQLRSQLADGITTYAFLYGGGTATRTRLQEITVEPSDVDEDRMAGYYNKRECSMFFRLSDFEDLPAAWLPQHVVLASAPDPTRIIGGLANQTTPLFVYERFVGSDEPSVSTAPLDLGWLGDRTLWPVDELEDLLEAVKRRGQVILAGPPGTGKTWIAKQVAKYLTNDEPLRWEILQFHPSYGYEEFVEGLRPVAKDGMLTFQHTNGLLLEIAEAVEETDDLFVLVIDEINRANIPRVFGELLYLLEYRDESIRMQSNQELSLPRNLKIIATMNTADRSTRSIDTALRRRFEMFECPADEQILRRYYESGRSCDFEGLIEGFADLNRSLTERLDRHHTIGQSFFMREHLTAKEARRIWDRQIQPLLEDYFFDQRDILEEFQRDAFWPDL
ncbi:MAG TPA: DUF3578 domain-containing protein [Solirubrobacterales bacterium]